MSCWRSPAPWFGRRRRLRDLSDDEFADDDDLEELKLVDSRDFGVRLAGWRLLGREFDSADVDSSIRLPRPIRLFSRPMVPSVLVPF